MPAASGSDENWWRGAVIYQVYPRSFQDTDGDGMGDLRGVTRRLPHIASLGVDAIWLSPFFTSPQADMGYDVSDYCDVDPMFGTLADFDEMLAEAHRLGLKVIIDQVISHTSDRHPWFVESRSSRTNPKADWYVWADPKPDGTAPNNWLSIFGGPGWEWDGVRRQYYLHNFLSSQPDLNFHNPEVQEAVLATVRFWLDRGVDGFRLDTANFYFHDRLLRDNPPLVPDPDATSRDAPEVNPYGMQDHLYDKTQPENLDFLRRFRAVLDEYGGRATVGEVGDGSRSLQTVAAYTSGGDKLHMCYTFDLLGPEFTARHFRRCVENFQSTVTDGWVCWAFSNHDVMRHVSRFALREADRERVAKLAISLLASLRGTICLYQGEELGLPEAELAFEELRDPYGIRFWPAFAGRDGCRTPMVWERELSNAGFSAGIPWLPVRDGHRMLAVDAQEGVEGAVLEHYRQTLGFRRAQSALVDGDMVFLGTNQDLLVFTREKDDERLLFVFNLTQEPQTFHLPTTLVAEPHPMPGFAPVFADNAIKLAALDVFCGRLR
ncbi:alpha amylase catalytic protein [Sinorhizobium meliloti CCNWSX0020]|uniref:Alpha amylase catalytic protein n=2 Tax=Sinorhizobium TaxID=28105 RepID=H0G9F5_RHIML|nr:MULTISPECIES: alpha-glucosidase family protein [Sinorhizobium]EHK74078.1 alpha amylase catalytic protein [Sinorhizobium meliloti CCNWSX0020]RVE79919.1 alpha-glucosidase [Sinorhizobium meliloti]RVH29067.1 alpha-glucosidase [Sinorhizobium meliloti]RVH32218.1 alpha-glucosidase [Sinorhizobium meliloti]WHS94988.1 alpha-glucosidase family protein [Sinorhizobium kummerowiae]